ncbi:MULTISPECIES: hydroxypyruvate isomerase family protein [unclassified Aureimonas]|uniref:hydroxypyruvate isomerase family protein n=1 Tax=unclassified Aureimonas TaxID=2615206 RepID=UPI0006F2FDD8|nr:MULTISPECIES: TIM barrel protein [unclassified Aureimonas]KQT60634.1 isomerase [Aureimonas sp. Leaf460]KQT68763.1 isomerase [Aureimonas sp. Leaf427]
MIQLSANLGFLWKDRALPDAIRAAKAAGFDAVECHWPYEMPAADVRAALDETGLSMLGLNTRRGREGENGLSAMPGRESEARAAIDEAFDYGSEIGAGAVHVMAGASRGVEGAREAFLENLAYAADLGGKYGMVVLIEPLNARDAPGYFHQTVEEAADIVGALGRPEVRIMFDLYHQQIMGGDLVRRFERHRDLVGHVQFAAVPSRAEPDEGEVAFERLLPALGWSGPFGAEYRPRAGTDDGLGWMRAYR